MALSSKQLLLCGAVLLSGDLLAGNSQGCDCRKKQFNLQTCDKNQVQTPTWWGWITSDKSSQFHFFQLVELLHDEEDNKRDTSSKSSQDKNKV